jgi:uncharacterized protein (TIGR02246 family)
MLGTRCSVAAIALIAFAGCISQRDSDSSAADIAAVQQLMTELDAAIAAGDLDGLLSFLAEDFVDMPPNEPAIMGKQALRTHHEPLFEAFNVRVTYKPVETNAFGDVVIQRGASVVEFTPKAGGDPVILDQKYLYVFRRQEDGSFKLWRNIFNNNAPLAAAQ